MQAADRFWTEKSARRARAFIAYGILFLPLMVMRDQHLIEKHAKSVGLGDVNVSWSAIDGANVVNDAMLAGKIDIAGTGAPGFITLWSKAQGIPPRLISRKSQYGMVVGL